MSGADLRLPWLRFKDEAVACPACGSPRIELLDVFPIPRDTHAHWVAFATGCHGCGLLFANPLPAQGQMQRYYSGDGPWAASQTERIRQVEAGYARQLRGNTRPPRPAGPPRSSELLLRALAPYLPVDEPRPGMKVLDFGCGDGKFLDRLQSRGWETYGMEPSISTAFVRHRRLTTPPRDGSFDFIILHHVLEHVTNPLGLLQQLADAARDGGILFVSVPRLDTLPQHRDFRYCLNGRGHVVCFSESCLTGLLARAGFETVARLDAKELDEAVTEGKPLRLRLVAARTAMPPPPPGGPLAPGVSALRDFARGHGPAPFPKVVRKLLRKRLPVRVRAALMYRAHMRSRRRHAKG